MRIRQLRKLLEDTTVKTVTVDVFDTVLLRKVYPEDLQYYFHGKHAARILRERVGMEISPFAFASLRRYVRKPIASERVHQGFDGEARLEECFTLLLDVFLIGRGKTMSDQEKRDTVDALIVEELALEKRLLRPNMRLVSLLRNLKDRGVRVYFLSDMYLSRDHVRELFEHFGIADCFDGGVTSSDLGFSKGSGKMFERIVRGGVIVPFDLHRHVHIGDHKHADGVCAKHMGCESFLLRGFQHIFYRPIISMVGRLPWTFLRWRSSLLLRRTFHDELHKRMKGMSPDSRTLFRLGFEVFGPPLLHYLSYLHASSVFGKRPIHFLSREAPLLAHLFRLLFGSGAFPVHTLTSMNRITSLRAFAYLALTRTAVRDTQGVLELFWWGQGKSTVRDFLESIGVSVENFGLPEFLLHRCDHEEIVKILASLCESHSRERDRLLEPLERACHAVKNELNAAGFLTAPRLIVADIGWHGSVLVLLQEISALLGSFPDMRGIYLGTVWSSPFGLPRLKNVEGVFFSSLQEQQGMVAFVPEIWEQILSRGGDGELRSLIEGIEACLCFWKERFFPPDQLLRVTAGTRQCFFLHPRKDEVRLLGPLEHDVGAGLTKFHPLVNTHLSRRCIWKLFFLKPKVFMRIYRVQYWQRGFLRWYGLHPFFWLGRCTVTSSREQERERAAMLRELYDGPVDYAPLNVPVAASRS